MFCRTCHLVLAATPAVSPRAYFKNFVNSDAMALLDSQCEKCCYVPRVPEQKVTVIGAGSDIGQIASLFLKQQKVIKTLAIYEDSPERGVLGVANDLAHIDTSTEIEAFQGRAFLKAALENTDVVLICGGCVAHPLRCDLQDRDLFFRNMHLVRTTVQAIARFAPHAFVAVQTPPVDCNFALALHTLKLAGAYDKRRLVGINSINAMRATQLYCASSGANPCSARVPVVCGTGRCTRVPVFSCANAHVCDKIPGPEATDCITRLVREADDIVFRIKCSSGQAHLSTGFSSARCVLNIMTGLFETPTEVDSALVEQNDPGMCYGMPFCATPVTVGSKGIETYKVPKLNPKETKLLEDAKCDFEDMMNLGRCYATGDEYYLHPCMVPPMIEHEPCLPVKPES